MGGRPKPERWNFDRPDRTSPCLRRSDATEVRLDLFLKGQRRYEHAGPFVTRPNVLTATDQIKRPQQTQVALQNALQFHFMLRVPQSWLEVLSHSLKIVLRAKRERQMHLGQARGASMHIQL